jgi:imidazolonepropionase-like amidohydrolase
MMSELIKNSFCNPVHRAPKLHGGLLSCVILGGLGALVFPGLSAAAMASAPQASALPDPYPSTYKPLPRTDTLIDNATVLDGIGHRLLHTGVLLHDGKIIAVGPNLHAPEGAKTIDAQGRFVTPGLIDVHSHLGDFAAPFTLQDAKVSDVSEESSPNSAEVWALHSIRVQDPQFARVRAGGVTTVQILPGSDDLFGGRGVVLKNVPAVTVQEMEFPGAMPSLKMACGENPKYTFGGKGKFPSSEMGNVAGYRQAWIEATEYKRRWDDYYAKHDPNLLPPARDLKLETLAAVLRGQILVDMHCYRADEMAVMIDVAKEFDYQITAFHHAVEAYKIVPLLKENHVCVAVWGDWWGFKVEAYDGVRSNAAFVDADGGCVMLHSDATISAEHLPLEAALSIGAARRAGVNISEEHAIEWLTNNPAKALHLDGQIGSLEPGKNADIVVWSGDPFSVYTRANIVIIDGAIVYDRNDTGRQATSDFEVGQPAIERPQ